MRPLYTGSTPSGSLKFSGARVETARDAAPPFIISTKPRVGERAATRKLTSTMERDRAGHQSNSERRTEPACRVSEHEFFSIFPSVIRFHLARTKVTGILIREKYDSHPRK